MSIQIQLIFVVAAITVINNFGMEKVLERIPKVEAKVLESNTSSQLNKPLEVTFKQAPVQNTLINNAGKDIFNTSNNSIHHSNFKQEVINAQQVHCNYTNAMQNPQVRNLVEAKEAEINAQIDHSISVMEAFTRPQLSADAHLNFVELRIHQHDLNKILIQTKEKMKSFLFYKSHAFKIPTLNDYPKIAKIIAGYKSSIGKWTKYHHESLISEVRNPSDPSSFKLFKKNSFAQKVMNNPINKDILATRNACIENRMEGAHGILAKYRTKCAQEHYASQKNKDALALISNEYQKHYVQKYDGHGIELKYQQHPAYKEKIDELTKAGKLSDGSPNKELNTFFAQPIKMYCEVDQYQELQAKLMPITAELAQSLNNPTNTLSQTEREQRQHMLWRIDNLYGELIQNNSPEAYKELSQIASLADHAPFLVTKYSSTEKQNELSTLFANNDKTIISKTSISSAEKFEGLNEVSKLKTPTRHQKTNFSYLDSLSTEVDLALTTNGNKLHLDEKALAKVFKDKELNQKATQILQESGLTIKLKPFLNDIKDTIEKISDWQKTIESMDAPVDEQWVATGMLEILKRFCQTEYDVNYIIEHPLETMHAIMEVSGKLLSFAGQVLADSQSSPQKLKEDLQPIIQGIEWFNQLPNIEKFKFGIDVGVDFVLFPKFLHVLGKLGKPVAEVEKGLALIEKSETVLQDPVKASVVNDLKNVASHESELIKSLEKANAPPIAENVRPLDYGHSAVQYENLKKALQTEEFTSIIDVTEHGLERLIERKFQPNEVMDLFKSPDLCKTQVDGAKVFVKKIGIDKYNFMIYNPNKKSVITALRHINHKDLVNLAKNYGWAI